MITQGRLTKALHEVADSVAAPQVDLSAVRSRARANRTRAVSAAAAAAAASIAVAVIVTTTTLLGGGDRSVVLPASGAQQTAYTSAQYGFTIVPPPGWQYESADRAWSEEADIGVRDWNSQAYENFSSPDDDVVVSAWSVPLDPGTAPESMAALGAWVEDYCLSSGESPCFGIADRAVALCGDESDCSVGLIARFNGDSFAFFTGGTSGIDTMTVVAVWRPETDTSVAPYGGASKLLLRFLAPMRVWPGSPARPQRD